MLLGTFISVSSNVALATTNNALTINGHAVRASNSVQKQIKCLALNIYHEARGSTDDDMFGVAKVTINRVKSSKFGNTICEVVFERKKFYRTETVNGRVKKVPYYIGQFSWTHQVKNHHPKELASWEKAKKIAWLVYFDKNLIDKTKGATHFYDYKKVKPSWSKKGIDKVKIGSHMYMKLPDL